MDGVFFEQLSLEAPKYNLEVGSGTHAQQTSKVILGTEPVLTQERPDILLVEGDTNSVLGGALAAVKCDVRVGHVEAGLRSFDRRMPEEINRVLTDHCSDYLFAPTQESWQALIREGIPSGQVLLTGNTIVDAIQHNLQIAHKTHDPLSKLGLSKQGYLLATVHRQENVDNKRVFRNIIEGLKLVQKHLGLDLVYPIHPRAAKQLKLFGIDTEGLQVIEPMDYFGFLKLERDASLVLTDSGGIQEEACVLRTRCVTLRGNTERPETLTVGSNVLAGTNPMTILKMVDSMLRRNNDWSNPFGDGRAGNRIVDMLTHEFE